MNFLGCDVSPNHAGFVSLNESGEVNGIRFLTEIKATAERGKDVSAHFGKIQPKHIPDSHAREMLRLANSFQVLRRFIRELDPSFAYLEGYAYGAHGGELIGEIAAGVKLTFWQRRTPFRIMDVISVKLFAAHNGNAEKSEVVEAVRRRWGVDFSMYEGESEKRTTEEDLSDAYTLARMCLTEWRLRSGLISLPDLEHDKERQVYLRTTKVQTVNILGSEWTCLDAIPEKWR